MNTITDHDRIWLIDMGDDIVWCDDPNPSGASEAPDAREFVSLEKHNALAAQANIAHAVGHALGLPAGSDVTRDVLPAVHALAAALHLAHVCHACGANTPPPRPYSFHVACEKCGEITAATAAFQPEARLAKLKAEWQAEALSGLAESIREKTVAAKHGLPRDHYNGVIDACCLIDRRARDLRRQADESNE